MFKKLLSLFERKPKTMTFDIIVFEEDELADGSMGMKQHPENGVQAKSRKELIGIYAMAGQKIKILREYGGQRDMSDINASPQNIQTLCNGSRPEQNSQNAKFNMLPQVQTNAQHVSLNAVASEPKLFKVAGIECKLDGDKLYQKQWVKMNDAELQQYRLALDTNNKIVPLTGKHLEKLTWVQVEDNA